MGNILYPLFIRICTISMSYGTHDLTYHSESVVLPLFYNADVGIDMFRGCFNKTYVKND